MISDTQREVAVHLLANALRKLVVNDLGPGGGGRDENAFPPAGRGRRNPDEEYVRGMIDMLNGLYGKAYTDELFRAARQLERTSSMRRLSG